LHARRSPTESSPPPPRAPMPFMDSARRLALASKLSTLTFTTSPMATTSAVFLT
jgi:hypothetical protein